MTGRDAERFAGVFVQNSEHFVFASTAQPVVDEVNAPNVVGILGPKANDGAVFVIEALSFFVTLWKLQAFFTPQALNLLVIDLPAFNTQEFGDLAVAVAAILFRQTN